MLCIISVFFYGVGVFVFGCRLTEERDDEDEQHEQGEDEEDGAEG